MAPDELTILDKGDYILTDFCGEFSVEAGKRCIDRMVQACGEHNNSVVLLDCRRMTGRLTISSRFQVVEYGQTALGTISRLALVSRPENTLPDGFEENVAVNRGLSMRIFTDIDEAIAWLRS